MAEEEKEEKKKSGGKGLIIVLIVLIVLLLLAVAGGAYYIYSGQNSSGENLTSQEQEKDEPKEIFKVDINDLVLNITNAKGREKLMKLSFSLRSTEPTIQTLVEENKAEIIDAVIGQVIARSSEELLTVGGKNLLREELKSDINKVINEVAASNSDIEQDSIKKLLFTSFVIK